MMLVTLFVLMNVFPVAIMSLRLNSPSIAQYRILQNNLHFHDSFFYI